MVKRIPESPPGACGGWPGSEPDDRARPRTPQKPLKNRWKINIFESVRTVRTDGPYGPSVFHWFFFNGFWGVLCHAGSAAVPRPFIRRTRRTPQGRIQGSFLPLEEPSSETLLGKKENHANTDMERPLKASNKARPPRSCNGETDEKSKES